MHIFKPLTAFFLNHFRLTIHSVSSPLSQLFGCPLEGKLCFLRYKLPVCIKSITLSIKSIFIWCFYPIIDVCTWCSLGVSLPMTQLIILIALLLSFRCLMQPLVPFVVLLSCSVSFIPPGKSRSAWTPIVDLGLSSGASAGEASPQPFVTHTFHCTAEGMMWVMKRWEEQTVLLGLPQAVGIAGSYVETAVWRMWFVWAGHGRRYLDLEEQSISTAAHWPPAALLLSLQSLPCFLWWKQCFTNITLRKWFPCVLFFFL